MNKSISLALGLLLISALTLTQALINLPTNIVLASPNEDLVAAQDNLKDPVKIRLTSESKEIKAGKSFLLDLELTMEPGWHTYYKDPGESGLATSIKWTLPEGFSAGDIIWEKPTKFTDAGVTTFGYHDKTILKTQITPPAQLANGTYTFTADVTWLACKEICLPGKGQTSVSVIGGAAAGSDALKGAVVPTIPATPTAPPRSDVPSQIAEQPSLLTYLFFAFIGGLILNIMPCVLPVISIKVLSFLEQSQDQPEEIFKSGLIFSSGIIASFMSLALIVIVLRGVGQSIGWGFQFQHPAFLILMCTVVLLLSLSLMGLFYITPPVEAQSGVDHLAMREGPVGTFFKGVLATVLSTPCTAPFLGTAIGFAFTQPSWIVAAIFFAVSLGMASPYILLTHQPQWMRYLPKPGIWMDHFKVAMGFLLMATVVWLLSVLGQQIGVDGTIYAISFLLAVAFAAWLIGTFVDLRTANSKKATIWAIALTISVASYFLFVIPALNSEPTKEANAPQQMAGLTWIPYTKAALAEQIALEKTVFLDFTADWCLTCKVNEQTVIATKPIIEKLKALNVVIMKADWTRQNPEISDLLKSFGRSGVPLYVIYPASNASQPIVLPEIITQSIVLDALTKAGPSK